MTGVPSLFSRKRNYSKGAPADSKGASSQVTPTPPPKTKIALPPPSTTREEQPLKRQKVTPGKKGASSTTIRSVVYHYFDGVGDIVATPEELSSWTGKTPEEKKIFMLKASAEMLVHQMDREAQGPNRRGISLSWKRRSLT